MARKRMIDPNIWQSEDFAQLDPFQRLVFIGMFSNADDLGRGRAKAIYLKSILFPYDEGIQVGSVAKALDAIGAHMSVTFYRTGGSEYYQFDRWERWQKIDRPSPSKLPSPEEGEVIRQKGEEPSSKPRRGLAPNKTEGNREKREEEGKAAPTPAPELGSTLQKALEQWFRYKEEKGEGYGPTARQALTAEVAEKLGRYPEEAIVALVGECMAHNWKGIIWERLEKRKAEKKGDASYDIQLVEDWALHNTPVYEARGPGPGQEA